MRCNNPPPMSLRYGIALMKPGDDVVHQGEGEALYSPHAANASLNARSPGAPFSIAMMARRWLV
ncbi:hypothetical protein ACVW17_002984 [Bradyrhizobium sp. USDA 4473]